MAATWNRNKLKVDCAVEPVICLMTTGINSPDEWTSFPQVVDHFAKTHGSAAAVEDAEGVWTYAQLRDASLRAAAVLSQNGLRRSRAQIWIQPAEQPLAPRPLAVWLPRSREFFALCFGAWRLGVPVIALSGDMAD